MKTIQKLQASTFVIAITISLASPMKRTLDNQTAKKESIFNLLMQQKISKKTQHLRLFFINKYKNNNKEPLGGDKEALDCIFTNLIATCITRSLINDIEIISHLNQIENDYLRSMFFKKIIKHLRTLIPTTMNDAEKTQIKKLFISLKDENFVKWAIRLIYNQATSQLIDTIKINHINKRIQRTELGKIDLSRLNNQEPIQLFLDHAIELIEPLCGLKITNLSLYLNDLTSLPAGIFRLSSLQKLYLSINNLTNISPEIGKLTKLKELYLHNNQLDTIPKEIGSLTNLKKLNLSYNKLKSIPDEITCLKQNGCRINRNYQNI